MEMIPTNPQALSTNVRADPISALPIWIQYLIGAFPTSKTNKRTYGVLQSHFADYDDGIMLDAVKAHVSENKFWPAVSELREYADEIQSDDNITLPFQVWHKLWAAKNWTVCEKCGERTPDVNDCPFCKDME